MKLFFFRGLGSFRVRPPSLRNQFCRTFLQSLKILNDLPQHLDDLAESFLMSVFHNGRLRTMKANYSVKEEDLRVIRDDNSALATQH